MIWKNNTISILNSINMKTNKLSLGKTSLFAPTRPGHTFNRVAPGNLSALQRVYVQLYIWTTAGHHWIN